MYSDLTQKNLFSKGEIASKTKCKGRQKTILSYSKSKTKVEIEAKKRQQISLRYYLFSLY